MDCVNIIQQRLEAVVYSFRVWVGRREIIKERVLNWIEEFNAELSRSFPGLTIRFPVDRCVEDLKSYDVRYFGSSYISSRLKRNFIQLENQYGKCAIPL